MYRVMITFFSRKDKRREPPKTRDRGKGVVWQQKKTEKKNPMNLQ